MAKVFVTKVRLPDGEWVKGPKVAASTYHEAEQVAINDAVYQYGYHKNDLVAKATRFDAKSVWKAK